MNHIVPVIGTIFYLSYPKSFRIDPNLLFFVSIMHNFALIIFSGWTCVSLLHVIFEYGMVFEGNYYFKFAHFDKIIFYFYLSKYYEYVDTFILYLNNKQPCFLQKYHHIGAVICWHLGYYYKVDGMIIASLFNSFVHTLMYSYYFVSLFKIKVIQSIKPYVTALQLIQLMQLPIGLYFYRNENKINRMIIVVFSCYVTFLIGLFGNFYWVNYIKNK
jgi:hypothetical protein